MIDPTKNVAFVKAEIVLMVTPDLLEIAAKELREVEPGANGEPAVHSKRVLLDLPGVRVTLLNPESPDVQAYFARTYGQALPTPKNKIVRAAADALKDLKLN